MASAKDLFCLLVRKKQQDLKKSQSYPPWSSHVICQSSRSHCKQMCEETGGFTRTIFSLFIPALGEKLCNSPLQTLVRQPASQQAATAVFHLPGAPGMQREPRRAAAQACVREQRALSVPKKQPRGDFHPIGLSAAAVGRARLGLWKEPRDGALYGSKERTLCYQVLSSVKPERTWASLCTATRRETSCETER